MSVITLKIAYKTENDLANYIKNYNTIFNLTYNFCFQNKRSSTEIKDYIKSKNNIKLDSTFLGSVKYDVNEVLARFPNKKIVFGGRKLFLERNKQKITKKEFQEKKLRPILVVGDKINKGNPKFQILNENEILFKPSRKEHFVLNLKYSGKNYIRKLKQLIILQEEKSTPITYKLDKNFIYISFENNKIENLKKHKKIKNRILAIDMNPNYVGWSVTDWSNKKFSIIESGIISLKDLNDYENSLAVSSFDKKRKYITNKRSYEISEIAHYLIKKVIHYRCEIFSIEDLNIKNSDKEKGRKFNRLVNNQWNRKKFVNIIQKLADLSEIKLIKVKPEFSSFVGNLLFRNLKLPDMILSSLEISRRGYEFYNQYISKTKPKEKNIIFPNLEICKNTIVQSLEELNCCVNFTSWKDLYYKLKKISTKYRFSISNSSFFSFSDKRSYWTVYQFS